MSLRNFDPFAIGYGIIIALAVASLALVIGIITASVVYKRHLDRERAHRVSIGWPRKLLLDLLLDSFTMTLLVLMKTYYQRRRSVRLDLAVSEFFVLKNFTKRSQS